MLPDITNKKFFLKLSHTASGVAFLHVSLDKDPTKRHPTDQVGLNGENLGISTDSAKESSFYYTLYNTLKHIVSIILT